MVFDFGCLEGRFYYGGHEIVSRKKLLELFIRPYFIRFFMRRKWREAEVPARKHSGGEAPSLRGDHRFCSHFEAVKIPKERIKCSLDFFFATFYLVKQKESREFADHFAF